MEAIGKRGEIEGSLGKKNRWSSCRAHRVKQKNELKHKELLFTSKFNCPREVTGEAA